MNDIVCENGLERKEWNRVLDRYLMGETMTSDDYEQMNAIQVIITQENKKALARIKYKQNG